MPIAIHTRYLPATDTRGARVKASTYPVLLSGRDAIWSVTIPYSYDGQEHRKAADTLRAKYWPDLPMVYAGSTIDGRGDVYMVG